MEIAQKWEVMWSLNFGLNNVFDMKSKARLLSVFLILLLTEVAAQVTIRSEEELQLLKETPLETIYIHHSSNTLFPGEYLYYSVYCINTSTYRLSRISSVAYIELVGEDGGKVFSQKITLEKGRGQGDFFIPVDIPSGNYKLLGFTNWMKNAGVSQFFQDDITIINPYRLDQSALWAEQDSVSAQVKMAASVKEDLSTDSLLQLNTDKEVYGKRALVNLGLRNFKGALGHGNYSIAVHKTDEFQQSSSKTALAFGEEYGQKIKSIPQGVNSLVNIPEQRGELIAGKVTNEETGALAANKWIGISLPGEDFQTKLARTDASGNFYTYVNKAYSTENAVLQLMDNEDIGYKFELYNLTNFKYDRLSFKKFVLSEEYKELLLKRSIHNQIENAYFEVKPDTLKIAPPADPFDGELPTEYLLEDYTRFPTLRETLVEVIEHVWVKKEGKEDYTFWVRQPLDPINSEYTTDPPLVTIDGILIPDHNGILELDANTIKTIKVLRNKYAMGSNTYQGMVVLETINSDYLESLDLNKVSLAPLLKPRVKKNYFHQEYAAETQETTNRIPDFRYQLLWEPQVTLSSEEQAFQLFTSDISGTYVVRLEGFTTYGKPISLQKTFTVQ